MIPASRGDDDRFRTFTGVIGAFEDNAESCELDATIGAESALGSNGSRRLRGVTISA